MLAELTGASLEEARRPEAGLRTAIMLEVCGAE